MIPSKDRAFRDGGKLGSGAPEWVRRRPATTVRTSAEVTAPTYRDRDSRWRPGMPAPSQATNAVRVTVEQAAILQSFPADYPWQGTRTRQFEQVGNAVPPPLAHYCRSGKAQAKAGSVDCPEIGRGHGREL